MPFPDEFETPRLRAERLRPDHLAELRRQDGDGQFMAMLGGVRDAAGTAAYLERNLRHWERYGFGLWMLRNRPAAMEEDRYLGRAVLRHLDVEGRDEIEVGYGFYPAYWGQGLATEIATACVRLAREALGLSTLVAITLPGNAGSRRVLVKAGLAYERDVTHAGLVHALYRLGPESAAG